MAQPQTDVVKDDGEFTEMFDARIGRVDLVGGAANGHRFLMAKSADAAMMPADAVRGLIQKFDQEHAVTDKTAPAPVAKADLEVEDLIETGTGTADTVPGSVDWEIKDAETATNVVSALGRIKAVLEFLAGRESQEGTVSDDWTAWDNEWDLSDAGSAVDYAISLVAPYAAGEQLEADLEDELAGITKALGNLDPRALPTLEGQFAIVKAGRVLSSANETSLRDAVTSAESAIESITKVLSSLPEVPAEVEEAVEKGAAVADKTEPVAKDEAQPEQPAAPAEQPAAPETPAAPEAPAEQPVEKADGDAPAVDDEAAAQMTLVYDANGNIIGGVDPAAIVTFAPTPTGGKAEEPAAGTDPAAADTTPAPSADAGTAVTKGTSEAPADGESVEQLLKRVEGSDDPSIQALAKALVDSQAEVELYKSQPAPSGVIANGGPLPTEANLRGQQNGEASTTVDQARVAELRKEMTEGKTAEIRKNAADQLDKLAQAALAQVRQGPGAPMFGGR